MFGNVTTWRVTIAQFTPYTTSHIPVNRHPVRGQVRKQIFIYLYSFLTSTLDGGFVVNATTRPLYRRIRAQVNPITGQQESGKQKTSCPAQEFEPIPTTLSQPPEPNEQNT